MADPLRRIVGERFPSSAASSSACRRTKRPRTGAVSRTAALAEYDAMLVELRQVLDKMLELETFNEVLDMLRQIIDEQEKVNGETKQKQKQKLQDLTE